MHRAGPCRAGAELAVALGRSGVDSVWVERLRDELADHFDDLYAAERSRGVTHADAVASANAILGNKETLFQACRDAYLPDWRPVTLAATGGAVLDSLALGRWALAFLLGSALTAATLFAMQLAVLSGV